MDTLIKADIFFFITTIAVVFVSIFFIIALYYMATAFRRMRMLFDKVEENIDTANVHVKEIIDQIKESFLFNILFGKKARKKKKP